MTESRQQICLLLDPQTLDAIYVSPAFDEIPGRLLDRLDPKSYRMLVHPDDLERVPRDLYELERTDLTERQFRIVCPGDISKWLCASTSVARNANGQIVAIVGVTGEIGKSEPEKRGPVESEGCHQKRTEVAL